MTLDLQPLNVLIGPNASGKSNLIDALTVLASTPRDLWTSFRSGGSFEDWIWKGAAESRAEITTRLLFSTDKETLPLEYLLSFSASEIRFHVEQESLRGPENIYLYRDRKSAGVLPAVISPQDGVTLETVLEEDKIDSRKSILSQVRDPIVYPQLTYVGDQLGKVRFFRGWPSGRGNLLGQLQSINLPSDFLLSDGSNLGLVLNDLQNRRETKRLLLEKLRLLYEAVEDVTTKVQGGAIQIWFHEEGLEKPVPAPRLSEGTLHYLCLLTILLHPDPPPLICIEEPELGLHPDVIPHIADLLMDASKRTQLIVTTHSETLVSQLSEVPESVVICKRDDRGTQLRRLEPDRLREWLEKYNLGELWAMGEIGGNR